MADIYVNQDYIECGFFNASEITPGVYDRVYSAEDMSNPYTRLITDGIFPARQGYNDPTFKVSSMGDLDIKIDAGEGIFWSKWFRLTQAQTLTLDSNSTEYSRIDSIIIEVNTNVRLGRVIYRAGTAAATPVAPDLINNGYTKEYRIANITVPSYATEIDDSYISDRRGVETPFCSSLIQTLGTQELFTQWEQLYSNYFEHTKEEVDAFIRSLTEDLNVSMSLSEIVVNTTIASDSTTSVALSNYDSAADILWIFVNGMMLASSEYSVNAAGTTITLVNEVNSGTIVTTRILKAVKAPSPAEGVAF